MPQTSSASARLNDRQHAEVDPARQLERRGAAHRRRPPRGIGRPSMRCSRVGAAHQAAQRRLRCSVDRQLAGDAAAVHHDARGRRSARISSSSDDTTSTAPPASRIARRRPWMNSIAPMSTPRVGWPTSSTCGSRQRLARQHQLLLVAAGELGRAQQRVARPHVVALHHRARCRRASRRCRIQPRAAVARRAAGSRARPTPRPRTAAPGRAGGGLRARGRCAARAPWPGRASAAA